MGLYPSSTYTVSVTAVNGASECETISVDTLTDCKLYEVLSVISAVCL